MTGSAMRYGSDVTVRVSLIDTPNVTNIRTLPTEQNRTRTEHSEHGEKGGGKSRTRLSVFPRQSVDRQFPNSRDPVLWVGLGAGHAEPLETTLMASTGHFLGGRMLRIGGRFSLPRHPRHPPLPVPAATTRSRHSSAQNRFVTRRAHIAVGLLSGFQETRTFPLRRERSCAGGVCNSLAYGVGFNSIGKLAHG